MPAFILINEATRCAKRVSSEQIRAMIDYRSNPAGGYTDVDRCMAMITSPENGKYRPFPFRDSRGNVYTIHVDGRMDFAHNLKWQPPDHHCGPLCLIPDRERRIVESIQR